MATSAGGVEPGMCHLIRWSKELSDGEKTATAARRQLIAECLGRHKMKCNQDKVPRVALLGSGGGLRAMIALMGTLSELGNQDLLDSIMYLCGVSGSTWCMSTIYEYPDWSKNLNDCESRMCQSLHKSLWEQPGMWHRIKDAIEVGSYSLTNLWSYLVGSSMIKDINENRLSNHKGACETGANPYPIYAAVEKSYIQEEKKKNSPGTWFEFTPHDAGFPGYGAFVQTSDIGSQFNKGELATMKAEKTILYLQGLWGSALASEKETKKCIQDYICSWFRGEEEVVMAAPRMMLQSVEMTEPEKCTCECCLAAEHLMTLSIDELEGEVGQQALLNLEKLLEECEKNGSHHMPHPPPVAEPAMEDGMMIMSLHSYLPSVSSVYEKMALMAKLVKCLISWQWGTTHNFLYKCSSKDTSVPSDLMEKEYISLIDAGLAINSAYPLVLRKERKVKLILSFDYSAGDPFLTLKKTAEYCKVNNIQFPDIKVDKKQEKAPSGCYIFKGPNAPTVMHFPLFNTDNCAGDVEKYRDTFSTFQTSYGPDNVDDLLRVSKLNVEKNKGKILGELAKAISA